MFNPETMKALRVSYTVLSYGRSQYEWRFMSTTADLSSRFHFPKGAADGRAGSVSSAFDEARQFAGWQAPMEVHDGELAAALDMAVNYYSYPERELWVENNGMGWVGQILERGEVLWEATATSPCEAAMAVGLKALDSISKNDTTFF
jgi:hypothetical protein